MTTSTTHSTPPAPASDLLRRRCSQTTDGHFVPPVDVVLAALRGQIRRVVTDHRGVVLDMGRRTRLFTGANRQAVCSRRRAARTPAAWSPRRRPRPTTSRRSAEAATPPPLTQDPPAVTTTDGDTSARPPRHSTTAVAGERDAPTAPTSPHPITPTHRILTTCRPESAALACAAVDFDRYIDVEHDQKSGRRWLARARMLSAGWRAVRG